jgi:hypothetical protein
MSDLDTMDSIDTELDNIMNGVDEDFDDLDANDEKIEESSDKIDTLENIMQDVQGTSKQKSDTTDQEINNVEQTKKQSTKQRGNNNSQDLVDADGNIIAKAGAERRFYEENVKLKRDKEIFNTKVLPTLKENYNNMLAKVQAYDETFKALRADDLTPDDIQTGLELVRQWKKSPADTMKFLLTQAKSYGINIDGVNSGVDAAAINQMLDQKLQPFIQEREKREQERQIQVKAKRTYDDFMSKYPDAINHTDELAYLYKRNPNMSLDAIYYQLRNHYAENGYDFNTPLAEILNSRKQKPNRASFNSTNVNQNLNAATIQPSIASVNKSYDAIIKEVMRNNKK